MNIAIKKTRQKDCACYIIIIIATTLCAALYARSTSIFYPNNYSYDGTIFMHIGQAIKNGYIPYRDVYDTKGPMLWLLEYIGQLIYDGRAGIYLLQILNLNLISVISYRAARYYLTEFQSVISVAVEIAFIIGTCRIEHTVEEFTYLYSIIAVYLTLKNMNMENGFINKMDYFVYGLIAMCAILTRVMDCVVAGSCIIFAGAVAYKQYGAKKLIVSYAFTLLGAVVLSIPFVIYFVVHNAIADWLEATVFFSIRYSEFNKTPIRFRLLAILLVPILLSIYNILKGRKDLPILTLLMSIVCGILYLIVGTTYNHYMTMAVPCIFLSLIQFLKDSKDNRLIVNLIFCIIFFCSDFMWMRSFASATKGIFNKDKQNLAVEFADNIKDIIGEYDSDKVYTYYTDPVIPVVNRYFSDSKYFAAQLQWSKYLKKKNEIYEDFIEGNNTWVVIDEIGIQYGDIRIIEQLTDNYVLKYQCNDIYLYKKK